MGFCPLLFAFISLHISRPPLSPTMSPPMRFVYTAAVEVLVGNGTNGSVCVADAVPFDEYVPVRVSLPSDTI